MSLLDVVIFDKTEQYHKRDVNRMILYFSGTGNSAYVAKVISEGIEDTLYSITAQIRKRSLETINSEKPLVFQKDCESCSSGYLRGHGQYKGRRIFQGA